MKTFLAALSLAVLISSASAATPLENVSAIAASLGTPMTLEAPLKLATPPASTAPLKSAVIAPNTSGSVSGYAWVTGNGFMNCSGGPNGSGWMSGWINLRADVNVTTADGASGTVSVNGTAYVSGSCQNGSGFVAGNAMLNGSGALYKAGRYVGSASLSGSAFINQYASGSFVWINQNVYLSGRYDQTAQ